MQLHWLAKVQVDDQLQGIEFASVLHLFMHLFVSVALERAMAVEHAFQRARVVLVEALTS